MGEERGAGATLEEIEAGLYAEIDKRFIALEEALLSAFNRLHPISGIEMGAKVPEPEEYFKVGATRKQVAYALQIGSLQGVSHSLAQKS